MDAKKVREHAAVAVTYLDHAGGMPAGLSMALQRLREALTATAVEDVAADAYGHACERMEAWQRKRAAQGKDVGTERSLCDGIEWLYHRVDALEAQQPAALAVPEGYALVPVEPTEAMQAQSYMGTDGPDWPTRKAVYRAMLAAAEREGES